MAPSSRSPTDDAHDGALNPCRQPSHHRARFPSLAEFPDSPSVYSHAYRSPDADVYSDTASFSGLSDSSPCLEFDDETVSTIRSLSTEDIQNESHTDDCTDDTSHRISLGGPKIRFHSRAPWETDDDISRVGKSDNNPRSASIGSRLRGKASRADGLIRTFTRGSSITSRPSIDSARSQVSTTSSFEITAGSYSSSRGALYDFARQSVSTSFAPAASHPKSSHSFIQAHDSSSRATVSLDGMVPPMVTLESVPIRPSSSDISRVGLDRSAKPSFPPVSQERQSRDQFVHPYANPDLVAPHIPSLETMPYHSILGDTDGSDSNSTVADSTSTRSAAFSVISTETSTTSLTSRDIAQANLRVKGKEISSPISVFQSDVGYVDRSTRFLSLHPPPAGFDGPRWNNINPRSPPVTLITLQEAQARERFRSNTVHTTVARLKPAFPTSDDIPEVTEDQAVEEDISGKMAHTRSRSTSAGVRHKTTHPPSAQLHSPETRGESPVSTPVSTAPGRTLKHKKSGFMRLFGGRSSEGEKERSLPPPIPPFVDACAEESLQTQGHGKTSKMLPPRVPRSSVSPVLHNAGASNASWASTHSTSSEGDGPDGKGFSSRRRQPPSLSIITQASDHNLPPSISAKSSPMGPNSMSSTTSSLSLSAPQSAPPGNGNFPGLKLRPVSASFSSHFTDMVADTKEELQLDVHTPSSATSSSTALSPFTPVSTRRSDDALATGVEVPAEEHLTIKGLQDQFVSAKKAWQQQIRELRGQIRDLTSELEDLRGDDSQEYCEICGRGKLHKRYASPLDERKKVGVVNRPRARTGDAARFASGN